MCRMYCGLVDVCSVGRSTRKRRWPACRRSVPGHVNLHSRRDVTSTGRWCCCCLAARGHLERQNQPLRARLLPEAGGAALLRRLDGARLEGLGERPVGRGEREAGVHRERVVHRQRRGVWLLVQHLGLRGEGDLRLGQSRVSPGPSRGWASSGSRQERRTDSPEMVSIDGSSRPVACA